jgi:hypothetical protein
MKRPSLKFDKEALLGFLFNHCEKFVVGLVGLIGLALVWNGVNALRLKSVRSDQTPEAVAQLTTQTVQHIDAATKPPAETIRKGGDLAAVIDPWRPQQVKIAPAPEMAMLDRPLVQELAKRAKPAVLPIEDLRALAGVAVVPDPTDPGVMIPPPRGPQLDAAAIDGASRDGPPRRPPGRRPRPAGRDEEPRPERIPGEVNPAFAGMPRGKVMPYVLVTGLVPAAKQRQEYERAFGGAGFRNPQLDLPRWSTYLVERSAIGPTGAAGKWERLKVKNVENFGQQGGMAPMPPNQPSQAPEAMQQDPFPQAFLLGNAETDVGYAAQLPQRIDDAWGLEAVHPWFRSQLKKLLEEAAPDLLGDAVAVPMEARRLLDPTDELDGQVVLLDGMQIVGDPQRSEALVAFAVKSADGTVSFPAEPAAGKRQPVFVMTAGWARTLELDDGPKRDTTCRLRVRIEKFGTTPVARILGITYPAAEGEVAEELADPAPVPLATLGGGMAGIGGDFTSGGMGDAAGGGRGSAEFRLFRFLDTTVKPGVRYRYRVRLSLSNPNFGVPSQYLDDPTAAKTPLLPSPESNETPPVTVPDPVTLLVQTLSKEEIKEKKIKAGSLQLLVLAPSDETGTYSMRSLITEPGGLANVDSSLNKPGDVRTKGDDVITGRVLVDVRGRQEEAGSVGVPPETFELLFIHPDGTCEAVSAADSQRLRDRYLVTLEPPEAATAPPGLEETLVAPPRRGANK